MGIPGAKSDPINADFVNVRRAFTVTEDRSQYIPLKDVLNGCLPTNSDVQRPIVPPTSPPSSEGGLYASSDNEAPSPAPSPVFLPPMDVVVEVSSPQPAVETAPEPTALAPMEDVSTLLLSQLNVQAKSLAREYYPEEPEPASCSEFLNTFSAKRKLDDMQNTSLRDAADKEAKRARDLSVTLERQCSRVAELEALIASNQQRMVDLEQDNINLNEQLRQAVDANNQAIELNNTCLTENNSLREAAIHQAHLLSEMVTARATLLAKFSLFIPNLEKISVTPDELTRYSQSFDEISKSCNVENPFNKEEIVEFMRNTKLRVDSILFNE